MLRSSSSFVPSSSLTGRRREELDRCPSKLRPVLSLLCRCARPGGEARPTQGHDLHSVGNLEAEILVADLRIELEPLEASELLERAAVGQLGAAVNLGVEPDSRRRL